MTKHDGIDTECPEVSARDKMLAGLEIAAPIELMRFTLEYEGELPSSGNYRTKLPAVWAMRNAFAPTLRGVIDRHPAIAGRFRESPAGLAAHLVRRPFVSGGFEFLALVRPDLHLICRLDIKVRVNHEPGSILTNVGDLDNRLKTLLDALRIPDENEVKAHKPALDPCPCLLMDDAAVTKLCIRTERYYNAPASAAENYTKIDIEAVVETGQPSLYSHLFASD